MRSPSLVFSGEQSKGRFALGMLNVYEGPIAPKTRHFILFSDLTVLKKSQKNLRSHFLMKIFMQVIFMSIIFFFENNPFLKLR